MAQTVDSVLEVYLFEAREMLERLESVLLESERENRLTPEGVNDMFRVMHTLKGSSAMMQFDGIAGVTHKLEDVLAWVRENGIADALLPELFELLFEAMDFLNEEIAKVESNRPLTIDIGRFLEKITNFLKKTQNPDALIVAEPAAPKAAASAANGRFGLRVFFDDEDKVAHIRAFLLYRQLCETVGDVEVIPESLAAGTADPASVAAEGALFLFPTEETRRGAQGTVESFAYTKKFETVDGNAENAPKAAEEKANAGEVKTENGAVKQNLINVNLSKLDSLVDLMGEFVITQSIIESMLSKSSVSADEKFDKAFRELQKLTSELQENVMSLRMVPVSAVFQKMNRIVRDMSKKLGKEVRLVIEGGDTEVDKNVADHMGDPLLHLVRNALDHGIETPEEREAAGKPRVGTVTLSARNMSGEIVLSVTDDGRGIDPEKVLKKAKAKGLLLKPESEYTPREIYNFLLLPGFSTNEQVTEYSGRGVGMDVVQGHIAQLGGTVVIDSEHGKGTRTRLTIPPTLAIINGMKINVGESLFIVPVNFIRHSFSATRDMILRDSDGGEIVKLRGEYYTLIRLHRYFGIGNAVTDPEKGILILVENQDCAFCLFADAILGEQQVVVKSVPSYLTRYRLQQKGISGCSILGDGGISLILDIQNLSKHAGAPNRGPARSETA